MPHPEAFARDAQGKIVRSEEGVPQVLPQRYRPSWGSKDEMVDTSDPKQFLYEDGRVRINLKKKVQTPEDFHDILKLQAATEEGRKILELLHSIGSLSRQTVKALNLLDLKIMAMDQMPGTASGLRPNPVVALEFFDNDGKLLPRPIIFFKKGTELGHLVADLRYALVVDSPGGIRRTGDIYGGLKGEKDTSWIIQTAKKKALEGAKEEAKEDRTRDKKWIESRAQELEESIRASALSNQRRFRENGKYDIYTSAHEAQADLVVELADLYRQQNPNDRTNPVRQYYTEKQASGVLPGIISGVSTDQIIEGYGLNRTDVIEGHGNLMGRLNAAAEAARPDGGYGADNVLQGVRGPCGKVPVATAQAL